RGPVRIRRPSAGQATNSKGNAMDTDEKELDVSVPSREAPEATRVDSRTSTGMTRRDLIKAAAVSGVGVLAAPAVLRAAETAAGGAAPIKFGLLEDRSGNFAIFGANKWHGTQLAIKEINDGMTLDGGVQGPGGPGVFAKTAEHAPTENIEDVVERGGDETVDATVWKQGEEYMV